MRFAKWVFLIAGITGALIVIPHYFVEEKFGRDHPPPLNHLEFFYGFWGVTLAWQFMFLLIGSDPVRFRKAMLPSMLEKASFAIAIPVLISLEKIGGDLVIFASMDALFGCFLFIIAYLRTPKDETK